MKDEESDETADVVTKRMMKAKWQSDEKVHENSSTKRRGEMAVYKDL